MRIRQEEENDHESVFQLIEEAFRNMEHSDHQEQFLVEKLRVSDAFIPELSLVMEDDDGEIAGHILFTKIRIENASESFESLALAPVSVKPDFQNQGIGSQLILHGHYIARELGYQSVILLGHEKYYPKFGYEKTSNFGISFPFEIPEENGMAIELVKDGLKNVKGVVKYPKEFGID
ncbi:GNAT family N-acetyltransferase [Chryseobacterium indologenes]|uniref:GNAT family N-acetyltransferase n=1 Tax=Chryseobacterium indologenes TaxID=253 RepID=UPI000BFE0004|nr:N-acetyltransferase [Chryseobacterium indologenes]ATN06161.1 GNAT family N-acetyltransferase [Chryseobacterium indologenes]AYY85079.1 N-acetyltransferase [Chryseobacterium indologenes]QIX81963.1 N-acetyltransferase [Chryseobacterium indologenes]TLX25445.1 N-acetyltransferase [Chryseobacterium indologenes]UDQ55739.1 N-acetyltransferase [Chryseobacterium indologenes]